MKTGSILRGDDGAASAVRALDLDREFTPAPAGSPAPDISSVRSNPLETEIARLRESLAASETRHALELARAREQAREQGREDALAGFRRDEAGALATLEAGVSSAIATFQTEIRELESLSLVLCDTALAKVLGDPGRRSELVTGAILEQLNIVKTDSVVTVRVSTADFANREALSQLAARLGLPAESVQPQADIRAGDCDILMRLGHIEVSIPDYLDRLRQTLGEAQRETRGAR